jgi:hypothetical protein
LSIGTTDLRLHDYGVTTGHYGSDCPQSSRGRCLRQFSVTSTRLRPVRAGYPEPGHVRPTTTPSESQPQPPGNWTMPNNTRPRDIPRSAGGFCGVSERHLRPVLQNHVVNPVKALFFDFDGTHSYSDSLRTSGSSTSKPRRSAHTLPRSSAKSGGRAGGCFSPGGRSLSTRRRAWQRRQVDRLAERSRKGSELCLDRLRATSRRPRPPGR